jgi:hypothetical protein
MTRYGLCVSLEKDKREYPTFRWGLVDGDGSIIKRDETSLGGAVEKADEELEDVVGGMWIRIGETIETGDRVDSKYLRVDDIGEYAMGASRLWRELEAIGIERRPAEYERTIVELIEKYRPESIPK